MRKRFFFIPVLAALAAYALLPLPGLSASLDQKIQAKQAQVDKKKRQEGVLTTDISRINGRISGLQGRVNEAQRNLDRVQSELNGARAELLRTRDQLEGARDRLARARAQLRVARGALADRLVELYKSDQPDLLTVILNANGFNDLLERTEFLERISDNDRLTVNRVRVLKEKSQKAERTLASLEARKQQAAETILTRRNDIAGTRDRLASAQGDLRSARNGRRAVLAQVREERHGAQEDLASLQAEQAKVQNQLAGGVDPGPIRRGSGQLIWPVNGPITGAFGEQRPGHIHAGIDIAVPSGTPIRAADNGKVVLASWTGGYGNYTCIQHTAAMSTCYAHQSRYGTSVGAYVKQGQVMGYVGNTGHSFGAHLHFEVRINGSPVNPLGYL